MRPDRLGVEGLPLRLLVTAAVLALTLPAVVGALAAHDLRRTEERVRGEALRVLGLAARLDLAGGGRASLTVDLRDGAVTGVRFLRFANAGAAGMAAYELRGQPERVVALPDPSPPWRFDSGADLVLTPGLHEVLLEHQADGVRITA